MNIQQYNNKVEEFNSKHNIQYIDDVPTGRFNKTLIDNLNNIKHLFTKSELKYLKRMDPRAPTMKGLPKVHTESTPIRPLVNFITAPT